MVAMPKHVSSVSTKWKLVQSAVVSFRGAMAAGFVLLLLLLVGGGSWARLGNVGLCSMQ